MMSFPPVPPPDELLAQTDAIAEATGMDQMMPGMGSFIAACVYILECAISGECRDCACETCSRIRSTDDGIMMAAGADGAS